MPPGARGRSEQLLLAEAVVAVNVSPGERHVESIAGAELVDRAQRLQMPVAAQMQVEVLSTRRLHRQTTGGRLRGGAAPWVELEPEPDGAGEDERRPDQLPAPGRGVLAQIG